jgi:ABC-type transporter lipoprotein component MlaA
VESRVIRRDRAANRPIDNGFGDRVVNAVAECITNVFSNANNVSNFFARVSGKARFNSLIEYPFIELEPE